MTCLTPNQNAFTEETIALCLMSSTKRGSAGVPRVGTQVQVQGRSDRQAAARCTMISVRRLRHFAYFSADSGRGWKRADRHDPFSSESSGGWFGRAKFAIHLQSSGHRWNTERDITLENPAGIGDGSAKPPDDAHHVLSNSGRMGGNKGVGITRGLLAGFM
jgi:hypothetical protein